MRLSFIHSKSFLLGALVAAGMMAFLIFITPPLKGPLKGAWNGPTPTEGPVSFI